MSSRVRLATAAAILVLSLSNCPAAEFDQTKLAAILTRMRQFVGDGQAAGVVTVVGNSKGVVHHAADGFQNLEANQALPNDTFFRIASMAKL